MQKLKFQFYLFFGALFLFPRISYTQTLLTRAEASNFTETSRYEEVIDFLEKLQGLSPNIKITSIGRSTEGREIMLVILGRPVPASPAQLFVQNKPAIYIQANIHAGEVEGKEAILMLMRDILVGEFYHLLDNQVLLITPNFNPDGNEKISKENRRNQLGPEGGVGVRYNGQFLDLNRDYMKLETPENLAAVQSILNRWDPMVLIDLHTTNGSYHQEPLTYDTSHNPNGNLSLPNYLRDSLFPKVAKKLKSRYNIMSVPYGDFVDSADPSKGWETFDHQPYYSTNYWGLRNRFAILNENYAYADYKIRILACYHFVELILEYTNEHAAEMKDLIRKVDSNTIAYGLNSDTTASFGIDVQPFAFEEPLLIHSYEFEIFKDEKGRDRVKKTDRLKDYLIPHLGDFKITKSVRLPKGYIFSANLKEVAGKLQQHGIIVEKFCAPYTLSVQAFQIEDFKTGPSVYQGHKLTTLKGAYKTIEKEFPANTYFVGMDQPLANLAAYLLEPESDCGLVQWNFFDRYLYASQWGRELNQFPVCKLMQPVAISKMIVTED